MRDFSYAMYQVLVNRLLRAGYCFQTLSDYMQSPKTKVVILRHDIDITALTALHLARLESKLGISGTYFFRTTRFSYRPAIIEEIAGLGHEIGYHYEDLTRNNGDMDKAAYDFEKHLAIFREIYPVRTVCMHGRSGSSYDNRDMWKTLNLADYGLIAEPYLSLDFSKVLYLSDTSQKWNGSEVALRDKVDSNSEHRFSSTFDIMNSVDKLPAVLMITAHPEYWSSGIAGWGVKRILFTCYNLYKKHYRNKRVRDKISRRELE